MAAQPQYQNDPRWAKQILGNGSTETIGYFGCLLVCVTNIGNHLTGQKLSVAEANGRFKAVDGFQGPWVRAFKIGQVFPGVNYQKHLESSNLPAPLETINAALAAGSLAAVQVDNSPAPGMQGHWVVIHAQKGDDYLIWDPYKREDPGTLLEQFGYTGTAAEIIQEGILFGKGALQLPEEEPTAVKPTAAAKPAPETAETTETTSTLTLKPTVDGLTMRSSPQVRTGNVLKHLARTSKLAATEPAAQVKSKLGRKNQWIQVRDITGKTGYIAAWYATQAAEPALGVQKQEDAPPPTPAPETVVRSKVSSLSLRSAPRVAANTLIRYLPLGTELNLQNEADKAKIGQKNSWVAVTTLENESGYVAAWLVTA